MINKLSDGEAFPFQLLSTGRVVAEARTPVIERTDYEVCTIEYITSGGGFLEIDGESHQVLADGIYFLHKHSDHRYWPIRENPWHKLCVVVDGALMEYLYRIYGVDRIYHLPDVPQLEHYFEALLHLGHAAPDRHRRAAVIFHDFVAACAELRYQPEVAAPTEILELKRALDRITDEKFSLENYSAAAGFSSAHLIRLFRKTFGCTPYEYLMRHRIAAAERLLIHTNLSVKEVAANLGFSDQYYFSNCFRKRNGVSPSAFRCRGDGK